MFRKTALAFFTLTAVAFAAPYSGGLVISVKAPSALTSIDGFKVLASIANTANEDVTVVNYGTVLDNNRPTRSFVVTKGGEQAKFTGVKLQLNINGRDGSAYTTIKAGETVTVEHDLAPLYDFESLGEGDYEVTPLAQLPVVASRVAGSRPELTPFRFTATPVAKVLLTGDIFRRELMSPEKVKRATVNCTDSPQAEFIAASYAESKVLAAIAADYITYNSTGALYKSYWRDNDPDAIRDIFRAVVTEDVSNRPLGCSDPYNVCSDDIISYTLTNGTHPMYFCPLFFDEVPTSQLCNGTKVADRNIRGGTVLHEMTHAVNDTDDTVYGCSADQELPADFQIDNADNYNCFATHVYSQTWC